MTPWYMTIRLWLVTPFLLLSILLTASLIFLATGKSDAKDFLRDAGLL